jgi:3-oxoacyl-[acyl-carrier protein] reductase
VKKLQSTGRVDAVTLDVSDAASVHRATGSVAGISGRIDILVANAGITGANLKTWEYPVDAWKQVIDVDLTGIFL